MVAYIIDSAVYHGVVDDEHFREVISPFVQAEQFGLQKAQAGETPACAGTVLILDAGDGVFFHGGEDEALFFGGVLCNRREGHQSQCGDKYGFSHHWVSLLCLINVFSGKGNIKMWEQNAFLFSFLILVRFFSAGHLFLPQRCWRVRPCHRCRANLFPSLPQKESR